MPTKIPKLHNDPKKQSTLRFVHISDTHNKTDGLNLPKGDVLLHTGDFTRKGTTSEVVKFNDWLGTLNFKYKIVICGNHDECMDKSFSDEYLENRKILTNATHFLFDEMIQIEGIKIYGTPYQSAYHDMGFNVHSSKELKEIYDKIPHGMDILMTHCPPYKSRDKTLTGLNVGCKILQKIIEERKPKYSVFGHIHESYGVKIDSNTTHCNAALCTIRYKADNKPIVFDLEKK